MIVTLWLTQVTYSDVGYSHFDALLLNEKLIEIEIEKKVNESLAIIERLPPCSGTLSGE